MNAKLFFAPLIGLLLIAHLAAAQACYLTSIVDASHDITTTISYDDQHQINGVISESGGVTSSYTVTTEMTPTGYTRTCRIQGDSARVSYTTIKITFDKANRIVMTESSSAMMHVTERFTYNASHQLTQIEQEASFSVPGGAPSKDHSRMVYTYPNSTSGNPSEIKTFGMVNNNPTLALTEDVLLTYDNRKAIPDDFPFSASPFRAYSKNNILTADVTYIVSENVKVKQKYAYTFNDQGYPLTKTYQFSGQSTTDTYEYNCQ